MPGVVAGLWRDGATVARGRRRARARVPRAGAREHAVPDRLDHEAVHGDAREPLPRARRAHLPAAEPHGGTALRVSRPAAACGRRALLVQQRRLLAGRRRLREGLRRAVRGGDAIACARAVRARRDRLRRAEAARARSSAGGRVGPSHRCRATATRRRGTRRAGSGRPPQTCFDSLPIIWRSPSALHEPRAEALGARYALGWWVRELEDGRTALEHEGSSAGYQSLLLLVPEESLALAVLTNSWRGSGLIRRVVESLGLRPRALAPAAVPDRVEGTYALDALEVTRRAVGRRADRLRTRTRSRHGSSISTSFPARALGGGVFGFARGVLMSHRLDFPRRGFARVGWVALPRTDS